MSTCLDIHFKPTTLALILFYSSRYNKFLNKTFTGEIFGKFRAESINHECWPRHTGRYALPSFWQPVALAEELNDDRPVAAVQVFGESLVLFRGQDGALGLIERNCAHRGADLCYGRLEDNGIRCPFHGWLFGTNGDCMEQPAEPEDSTLRHRVK